MNKSIIQAQDVILDRINLICGKFGLNNIMAQLYAVMYFSNNPLSLDDMVERLKISKGSASINIRALERYGVVKRVWVKGSRKDYYESEGEISKVIIDRIQAMVRNRLLDINNMISSSLGAINSCIPEKDGDDSARAFVEKLEKLKGISDQAQEMFDLFNAMVSGRSKGGTDEAAKYGAFSSPEESVFAGKKAQDAM